MENYTVKHLQTNMKQQLQNDLSEYLGELMRQSDNEFDWIEKDKITKKINAVYVLLGIDKHEPSWYEKVAKELKKIK